MAEAERQRTLGELRAELARRDAKIVQLESSVTDVTVAMAAVRPLSQPNTAPHALGDHSAPAWLEAHGLRHGLQKKQSVKCF